MDLSVLIIDEENELDRILESTNLDQYELMDLPMKQPGDWSHNSTGVGMASTLDTLSTSGLVPREGSSTELLSRVNLCQWSLLSSPLYSYNSRDFSQNMG